MLRTTLASSWKDVVLDEACLCSSRSGLPTIMVKTPAGRQYFLHSRQDPVEEAASLLGERCFHDRDVTILFGFGLGYLVQEMRKRMDGSHDLIVIEQRPDIFEAAKRFLDLSEILDDPRIRLLIGADSKTVIDMVKKIRWKVLSGKVEKLFYGPAVDLAPEAYRKLENDIECYVSEIKTSFISFKAQVSLRMTNLFHNLSALCTSKPATVLKNAYKGLPAVVVSAGPSLDKNIRKIREACRKAPVITVDAALKPLLASGITPDIVATLDPLAVNAKKFSGISPKQVKDTGLVYMPEGNRDIPDLFTGPRFFINSQNTFTDWLIGLLGEIPDFPVMYTVSHLAFFMARHMGCDPIIMTGFDFSFPGDRDHAGNCEKTWTADFETGEFVEIEGAHGEKVKTLAQFTYMLRLLEEEIGRTNALCIDATEGGARIKGTTLLSLEESFSAYLPKKQTESALLLREIDTRSLPPNRKRLSQGLSWFHSELNHVHEIIRSAGMVITKARHCRGMDGPEGRKLLSALGCMKSQVTSRKDLLDILGDLLSDLLIHETGKSGSGLGSETDEGHEVLQEYEYFFSELNKSLTILFESGRDYFSFPFIEDQPHP